MKAFKNKKYLAIMIVCFLLGGFNIFVSILSINAGITFVGNSSSIFFSAFENIIPNARYFLVSSVSFICLIYAAAFILSGVAFFYLVFDKEKNDYSKNLTKYLFDDDEKKVIDFLKQNSGCCIQKDILRLKLSNAKLSRIIKKLESKKILEKIKNGMTNRIILLKDSL